MPTAPSHPFPSMFRVLICTFAVGTASMNPRDLLASIRAVTISTTMGWIPTVEIRGVG
jgi:hypothetical protein